MRWKQQLCLSHARLRSTSTAVLEVHFRPLDAIQPLGPNQEPLGSKAGDEVIAWAFTKILQASGIVMGLTYATPVACAKVCYHTPRKLLPAGLVPDSFGAVQNHSTQTHEGLVCPGLVLPQSTVAVTVCSVQTVEIVTQSCCLTTRYTTTLCNVASVLPALGLQSF